MFFRKVAIPTMLAVAIAFSIVSLASVILPQPSASASIGPLCTSGPCGCYHSITCVQNCVVYATGDCNNDGVFNERFYYCDKYVFWQYFQQPGRGDTRALIQNGASYNDCGYIPPSCIDNC